MNLIEEKFDQLKEKGEKAFIGYVTFGYPSFVETLDFINIVYSYVDILEIGFPFSDPIADGEIIQKASVKALSEGVKLNDLFRSLGHIKKDKPIVLMLYANLVHRMGEDNFYKLCELNGVDGIIIPDVPYEESFQFRQAADKHHVVYIDLVSVSSLERAKTIAIKSQGFLYCVSRKGVTGFKGEMDDKLHIFLKELRKVTTTPLVVGFGIKNTNDVLKIKDLVDGVVIGSAIIAKMDEGKEQLENFLKEIRYVLKN
ncbi:tryptophan synthase subunit alpha [Pseudothermotoga thermarum]|uniref:Tryptophan synthase alpha chain n=1 Tax=Pseudothermotoga thermarum DSM 5069 TaxID=688269 RepID=F7YWY6_9THEM|nr:tryptophan synthase subunit alpha [Pseudothermotoga thermarum]AEH50578.1 tryptophan synthase, alpha subunit [Pseudothermotoga thermarum DSM 5069]